MKVGAERAISNFITGMPLVSPLKKVGKLNERKIMDTEKFDKAVDKLLKSFNKPEQFTLLGEVIGFINNELAQNLKNSTNNSEGR